MPTYLQPAVAESAEGIVGRALARATGERSPVRTRRLGVVADLPSWREAVPEPGRVEGDLTARDLFLGLRARGLGP